MKPTQIKHTRGQHKYQHTYTHNTTNAYTSDKQHTTTYTYHTITHTNCVNTYEKQYNDTQRILTRTQNNQQRINNYINLRNIIHTSLNAIKKQQKRKHNNDNT